MNEILFYTETSLNYKIEIPSVFKGYEIKKDLNKGAYSAVVKVQDQITKKFYAAKIIPILNFKNKNVMHLINKEIEILSNLSHPNIIKLETVIELSNSKQEKFYILIEELCPHGDLLTYVNTNSFKNNQELRMVSRGITEAVKYLHDEGIAHCDIKPENVLLTEQNVPKLCDFNLSKYIKDADQSDRSCTFEYSAPELHFSNNVDFLKADIWSLGITLFVIAELKLPYTDAYHAICGCISYTTTNKLLHDFIQKCLVYKPSKRSDPVDLLKDPYLLIDDLSDSEMILKAKQENIIHHKTNPDLQNSKRVACTRSYRNNDTSNNDHDDETEKADDDDNDNLDDMNITIELGFDFGFQQENDDGDSETSVERTLSDYLQNNYNEHFSSENDDFEFERIEDKICDNILKIKYRKKPKTKKKTNQNKKHSLDDDDDKIEN